MRALQLLGEMRPSLKALLATGLVEQTERREANGQVLLADCLGQLVHELEDEATPFLRRAAVLVRALVNVRAEELLWEISVSAVQFDPVEAGFEGCPGRLAVVLDCALDVLDRELDRGMRGVRDLFGCADGRVRVGFSRRVPDGSRGGDSGRAGHLGDSGTACVPELGVDVASLLVDGVDDSFPAGGLLGVEEAGDTGHSIALSDGAVSMSRGPQAAERTSSDGGMPSEMISPPSVARWL